MTLGSMVGVVGARNYSVDMSPLYVLGPLSSASQWGLSCVQNMVSFMFPELGKQKHEKRRLALCRVAEDCQCPCLADALQ